MKTLLAALILSNVLVASASTGATPEEYFGPLTTVDQVSVEVSFDDAPEIKLQRGHPLIEVDSNRATQLKLALLAAARERFQHGGFAVLAASRNVVRFSIVGGSFQTSSDNVTGAFLVQSVVCLADDDACSGERTVLGISDESQLQERLVEATVSIVDDFVNGKARWQQSRKAR